MSFSNLQLTTTSFSVDIEGTIDVSAPSQRKHMLFIVNPNRFAAPGFAIAVGAVATTGSFSGSPSATSIRTPGSWDYIDLIFASDLVVGSPLEGTLVGGYSSTTFDPVAVTSLNFYWVFNYPDPASGPLLGSASLSAVPDAGSTAALLGAGVVALAFARRRLG